MAEILVNPALYARHSSFNKLVDWHVWVEDQGDTWLMCAKKHGKSVRRIEVLKTLIPSDRINQHAAITFAAIL